jgi:hypothetical protein
MTLRDSRKWHSLFGMVLRGEFTKLTHALAERILDPGVRDWSELLQTS